ncbi:MAG: [FeFe] hydrogenase H-cluster radical SAM maturase HydE [Bacillota bacterium]
MSETIDRILRRGCEQHRLSNSEIISLLSTRGQERQKLFEVADRVRQQYLGDEVHLRGIIEFSNYCQQNCHYCGLRRDNQHLQRYRLQPDEIVEMAEKAGELGYKTFVLQSGEDDYYDREKLAWIIKTIKNRVDTALTLCVGERDYQEYRLWREKGADRYLLRHETADPDLYNRLHPGMELEPRINRLKWLKELGYQVGSGNLIGLPGQDLESIARDILLFKELELEMVGLGPFIAHEHTPLTRQPDGSVELTLKTIAITRLLLPLAHIPGTTALGTLDPAGRQKALKAGANVVMPNVTAGKYRSLYELYPDKICIEEEAENCRQCIGGIIHSLGRTVAEGYGHSPRLDHAG